MSDKDTHPDSRVAATSTIAACGLGGLAVTMVFADKVGGGLILPLIAIIGPAAAIASVWYFGRRPNKVKDNSIKRLESKISALEDRLKAAETVDAFEDRLAAKEAMLQLDVSSTENRQET